MTQKEKQLLLKDLSARLPYGLKVQIQKLDEDKIIDNEDFGYMWLGMVLFDNPYHQVKPYLRPMSSMTEDEREELEGIFRRIDNPCTVDEDGCLSFYGGNDFLSPEDLEVYIDFCNQHHLDFRGLIPMGLALEAPEDMYKTE